MTLSAFFFGLLAAFPLYSNPASGEPEDSLDTRPIHSIEIYSDNQWASNALTKWAAAGLAFGGDITSPVRTLTSLTDQRGGGIGGGTIRQGVALVLPSMTIGEAPEKGRWKTTVGLEHLQFVRASWTPGMARFLFGRHGVEGETYGRLGLTGFRQLSATSLKVGGIRTHRAAIRSQPMDLTFSWSVNVGEMHALRRGYVQGGSEYRWDADTMSVNMRASRVDPYGVGRLVSFDFGMVIEEPDGGRGRADRWTFEIRDWGGARFRSGLYQWLDTAFTEAGLPVMNNGEFPVETASRIDSGNGALHERMPSTFAAQWEREALRHPGVVWCFRAERNSGAPRGQAELVRSSGRGAVRTTVGIGYGGWGGTYIPLNLEFASRDVRQGRPGGTLAVSTRWLALPGSGGRMALGLNWHQTF